MKGVSYIYIWILTGNTYHRKYIPISGVASGGQGGTSESRLSENFDACRKIGSLKKAN